MLTIASKDQKLLPKVSNTIQNPKMLKPTTRNRQDKNIHYIVNSAPRGSTNNSKIYNMCDSSNPPVQPLYDLCSR